MKPGQQREGRAASLIGWAGVGVLGAWALLSHVLGAPRGVELTDEAFYWLQLRHWQQLDFQFSFFAAYLDGLFWLLRERLDLMRLAGAVLVMAATAWLFRQLAAYWRWCCPSTRAPAGWMLAIAALLGLMHYGFLWTLRGPSYNTLAFIGCTTASATLLGWLRQPGRRLPLAALYGLVMGMTLFSKVTTFALLMPLHLAVLVLHRRDWRWPEFLSLVGVALAGVAVNAGYITLRDPDWWRTLANGLVFQTTIETRDPLLALRAVLWSWQREAPVLPLLAMAAGLVVQALLLWRARFAAAGLALLGVLAILGVWLLAVASDRGGWLLLLGLAAAAVAMPLLRVPSGPSRASLCVVAVLMFGLPVAYSFGTNAPLAEHTLMAAPIPLACLLCGLGLLHGLGRLAAPALAAGSLLLALPVLAPLTWPWLHTEQTYRLRGPLGTAEVALTDNPRYRGLLTDRETASSLGQLSQSLAAAGFRAGQPMLEFTGGHPGLIDVLGGRPVGAAWLLGDYPGSSAAAAVVLARVDPQQLRAAWLLTSDDASRRIQGWQDLLDKQLGQRCHEHVLRLRFSPPASARFDRPGQPIGLDVWRPMSVCGPGGGDER